MRILTLRQPWASLVAIGEKTVENRRWATSYRGPIAIHAGEAWDPAATGDPLVDETLTEHGLTRADLPRGAVIAVAELVDVHQSAGLCCVPWGHHADGHQHLLLDHIRQLREPVKMTGRLGLTRLDTAGVGLVAAGL